MDRGKHHIEWVGRYEDRGSASSGVYIYRLTAFDGLQAHQQANK